MVSKYIVRNLHSTNTVKISYNCMLNLKQKIDGHNKSTLQKTNAVPPNACNCRQPAHCALDGNCLNSAVIYQATVAKEDNRPAETYVGLTENSFKTRYSNHKSSFRDSIQNSVSTSGTYSFVRFLPHLLMVKYHVTLFIPK